MALRVLIVDDSPAMRSFISRVVELSGLEVAAYFQAADGAEALRLLDSQQVDLILTDINMPGTDGEQFMARLRQDPVRRRIPVVVVSSDATASRIERMMAMGARGYLTKPFSPELLREELDRVLESAHA
jgi:two-component system, chemotaxis family, chemotaxis protein CheY